MFNSLVSLVYVILPSTTLEIGDPPFMLEERVYKPVPVVNDMDNIYLEFNCRMRGTVAGACLQTHLIRTPRQLSPEMRGSCSSRTDCF